MDHFHFAKLISGDRPADMCMKPVFFSFSLDCLSPGRECGSTQLSKSVENNRFTAVNVWKLFLRLVVDGEYKHNPGQA